MTSTPETQALPYTPVNSQWTLRDYWDHVRVRISNWRMQYTVEPGLYGVGAPNAESPVLVTANYKLSFDHLRRHAEGLSAWILVLNTRGINVWCAAGKGTFGTYELMKRIELHKLSERVSHRKIILPQLGAPGVSAHRVQRETGFRVVYGPVEARDLKAFIAAGNKATPEMRRMRFPLIERLKVVPLELIPAFKRYPLFAVATLLLFGLSLRAGHLLTLGAWALITGSVLVPVLLPWLMRLPFRAFAFSGWLLGLLSMALWWLNTGFDLRFKLMATIFFPIVASFVALNFTGTTTFTGQSGVEKEIKISVPLYKIGLGLAGALLLAIKLKDWGLA